MANISGAEAPGTFAWLYDVLSPDPTVQGYVGVPPNARIYEGNPPEGTTTWPCIVFAMQAPDRDTAPVGLYPIMANNHITVKAIDQTESYAGIAALVARVHTLIQGQFGTATLGGVSTTVITCTRDHAVNYPETDPQTGKSYRHLGAVYKISAQ